MSIFGVKENEMLKDIEKLKKEIFLVEELIVMIRKGLRKRFFLFRFFMVEFDGEKVDLILEVKNKIEDVDDKFKVRIRFFFFRFFVVDNVSDKEVLVLEIFD